MTYDLEDLKLAAANRIDEIITTLLPAAVKKQGHYRVGNIQGDAGTSMTISTRPNNPGSYFDHGDPDCKGNLWGLVANVTGVRYREAIKWVADFCHVSPVQDFSPPAKTADPESLARELHPLSEKCREYIANRKISLRTAELYGLKTGHHGEIIFPHFDSEGKLCLNKHWNADDQKRIWTNDNPIHTLFGKDVCDPDKIGSKLIITEGQWDALSLAEVGLPAASIPSGVSNLDWINQDYEFLSYFDEIVLLFDSDEKGREAARMVQDRLGRGRCLITFVPPEEDEEGNLVVKDANDLLKKNRGKELLGIIEGAESGPIAEIVNAEDERTKVKKYLLGDHVKEGANFFLPDFNLVFRPHEVTLWFGYTGHGKSVAIQNQIASLIGEEHMVVVASFEQQPDRTLGAIIQNYVAYPNLPNTDFFDCTFDHITQQCFVYKSMERTNPSHLLNTFIHAHRRHGATHFFIDNVMTLSVDRGDNTEQSNTADALRLFAAKYPIHLHVVAHPRKPPEHVRRPPHLAEIRGASEWGDMPQNILCVWRDITKAERIEEMYSDQFSPDEIAEYWRSTPCSKIVCRKQRETGDLPIKKAWFHKETKRYTATPDTPLPFYKVAPWEGPTESEEQ